MINYDIIEIDITRYILAGSYRVDKLDIKKLLLTYLIIDKYQQKDKELEDSLKYANFHTKSFLEAENLRR